MALLQIKLTDYKEELFSKNVYQNLKNSMIQPKDNLITEYRQSHSKHNRGDEDESSYQNDHQVAHMFFREKSAQNIAIPC